MSSALNQVMCSLFIPAPWWTVVWVYMSIYRLHELICPAAGFNYCLVLCCHFRALLEFLYVYVLLFNMCLFWGRRIYATSKNKAGREGSHGLHSSFSRERGLQYNIAWRQTVRTGQQSRRPQTRPFAPIFFSNFVFSISPPPCLSLYTQASRRTHSPPM